MTTDNDRIETDDGDSAVVYSFKFKSIEALVEAPPDIDALLLLVAVTAHRIIQTNTVCLLVVDNEKSLT